MNNIFDDLTGSWKEEVAILDEEETRRHLFRLSYNYFLYTVSLFPQSASGQQHGNFTCIQVHTVSLGRNDSLRVHVLTKWKEVDRSCWLTQEFNLALSFLELSKWRSFSRRKITLLERSSMLVDILWQLKMSLLKVSEWQDDDWCQQ